MSVLGSFFSWDQLIDYIENTMGVKYTENPSAWADACKELTADSKYVKVINDTTGEVSSQYVANDLLNGVGEYHVGSNYSGPETITGGGGVKTAPTAKSVITDSTTQTAVITEEAVGVKDVGVLQSSKAKGIIGGLMMLYGLVSTGIKVSNSKVYKDLCNEVFDTNFTEETPFDVVKNFLNTKIAVFTSVDNDDLVTSIPDSIADKMYNFLASHMEADGEIIEPYFNGLSTVYRWIDRGFIGYNPLAFDFSRYLSASNPTDNYVYNVCSGSDDLFKVFAEDYITMLMGAGYTVPTNVGDALVYSMEGLCNTINQHISHPVSDAKLINVMFNPLSGRSGVPITTPIALAEINFEINLFHNISGFPSDTDNNLHTADFNTYNINVQNYLAVGEQLTAGDLVKYKKRNNTGVSDSDYGYLVNIFDSPVPTTSARITVTYPANEQTLSYIQNISNTVQQVPTNGYAIDDVFVNMELPFYRISYSNLGVKGDGTNYVPDDYLVAAGFRKKEGEKAPDPTKTKEQRYPEQNKKTQVANPQVNPSTGVVSNNITDYTRSVVIFGDEDGDRVLNYGVNNTDEPNSYIDNRPQNDKLSGKVNINDPIDGFNEDTQNAIDDYNQSRNNPDHYPEPIPQNQPNPQYPVNPPADTSGDSGETPTPSLMEGVEASGMASIYNPTKAEIINFSAWLWSPNFFDNFIKIFSNPMDAIIGLHILYATPSTTNPSNIIVGYLDSGVSAKVVNEQFTEIDCGTVNIPEYYGNALDYEPYTQVHCYLPFIGIVALKPNDILGKQLNIKYGVDVLTGTCLAILTSKKGDSEIACYNFSGNCAVQVPLSGGNYAQMITGLAGFLVGGIGAVATANPIMALGAGASLLNTHLDVSHSGSIGANAGAMGVRKPYLIITRKSAFEAAEYSKFYGYPANKTITLGSCKGFTRVKSVHIETMTSATDSEKTEIETLLKEGVIIK